MLERAPLGATTSQFCSQKSFTGAFMCLTSLIATTRCLTKRQINLVLAANSRMIKVSGVGVVYISWYRNFWFFAFNYCKRPLVVFS